MELFKLPHTTIVYRVIPKNAFDAYTTGKQKKLFSTTVARITWLNKISSDTVNLEAREVKEIQVFKIELKVKRDIREILDTIDKAIPYNIIFIIEHGMDMYLSTSAKHQHPVNSDNAVIDWTFKSLWFSRNENIYLINLKRNLDEVYHDFCIQLSATPEMTNLSLKELIRYRSERDSVEKEILLLKKNIKNSKQYKTKVELNMLLKQKLNELELLNPQNSL